MNETSNPRLTINSKLLRVNMTKEEKHLWYDFLKKIPVTVNRQKVIGKYIVDFYIASSKIAIELDGSQHYEDEGVESDRIRDEYLNRLGIKVLRYTNLDIHRRFESVCQDILDNHELVVGNMEN
ncbi:MAG: endonuclease domain-containing protein [Ruminococcaceae bacterium]|nr:endonuclease domain-containing protein [Oscillospiraceae bacterium]